ncbi:MAG: methyltransferase domain-containing protein [Clostridia bacterium]|nr:methyltransferase domain-containing protein [Clostridia bacterium]
MANYNNFSPFYDIFTNNVDYKARARYLISVFEKHGKKPNLLLDFACGTGSFSVQFAKMGIEVIGVDKSEGMLALAAEKNEGLKTRVLYLCQSGDELDLYGTVDGAVSCLDSLNHITDINKLEETFSKISLFLEEGCLFVFDVNTVYKHKEVLASNSYRMKKRGVECVWNNTLKEDGVTVEINLNFTYKTGLFKKETVCETITERAYTHEEIENLLNKTGFKLEAVYGENTFSPPKENSQRNVYVARAVLPKTAQESV